jgi:IS1 family transposase
LKDITAYSALSSKVETKTKCYTKSLEMLKYSVLSIDETQK